MGGYSQSELEGVAERSVAEIHCVVNGRDPDTRCLGSTAEHACHTLLKVAVRILVDFAQGLVASTFNGSQAEDTACGIEDSMLGRMLSRLLYTHV